MGASLCVRALRAEIVCSTESFHASGLQAVVLDGIYQQESEVYQCDAKLIRLTDWTLPRFRQLIELYPFDEPYTTSPARAIRRSPIRPRTKVVQ
jgi:hypothetical protein